MTNHGFPVLGNPDGTGSSIYAVWVLAHSPECIVYCRWTGTYEGENAPGSSGNPGCDYRIQRGAESISEKGGKLSDLL